MRRTTELNCAFAETGQKPRPTSRLRRRRGARTSRRPSIPIGRSALDDGQVVDAVLRHQRHGASSAVSAETATGSAVIHSRTRASLECSAAGECAQHVARREDPDQPPVLGDGGRADVALAHLLGDLAERVLGRDDERIGRHDARRPFLRRSRRLLDVDLEPVVASGARPPRGRAPPRRAPRRDRLGASRGTSMPARLREEGREVAADDLRRRPPQGLRARPGRLAEAAGDLAAEIPRPPPVSRSPRRTGRNGRGVTSAPAPRRSPRRRPRPAGLRSRPA